MKKLSLLLIAVITLSACAKQEVEKPTQGQITQSSESQSATVISTETIPISQSVEMPEPFEHVGGDRNMGFNQRYNSKMLDIGVLYELFAEYLNLDLEEFSNKLSEKWEGGFWESILKNSLLESANLFSIIITLDIPDEVVIDSINKANEINRTLYDSEDNKVYLSYIIFTEDDIKALLSRDEAIVTAQFAEETAIVIGDRAYAPVWLYYHTPDDYRKAGITPEMLEEKLDSYAEFVLTDEADRAFSAKLTEFMGEEVSLKERRESRE